VSVLAALAVAAGCAAAPPLADANGYVRRLVGIQRHSEEQLSRYSYDVSESREDLDAQGRVLRRRTRSYEVHYVKGRPVRRLVARDGRPLPPAEQQRQDERARELAESIRSGRTVSEQPGVRISVALERYDFRFSGREELEARCALVFDFVARPGEFPGERDYLLRKLAGRLWVDEQEQAVARLDLHNTGGVKIALGIGANIAAASFHGEFVRLEPGVWLPRLLQGGAQGRKLLFFGFRVRETLSFGNYRAFEVGVGEAVRP
jgi:hypothetical protein